MTRWFSWTPRPHVQRSVQAYAPRHLAFGEGNPAQPRTGRHTPEYVALHGSTVGMYPLGGARRVDRDLFLADVEANGDDRSDGIWRP